MNKGDKVYYARILSNVGMYEVYELKIRTVADTWFSATEKRSKQTFLFSNKHIDKIVFYDRDIALEKVLKAEKENINEEY